MNLTVKISCCAQCIHLEEGTPLKCVKRELREVNDKYILPKWCPLPKDQKIERRKYDSCR